MNNIRLKILRFCIGEDKLTIQIIDDYFRYDLTHQQFIDNINYLVNKKYLVKIDDNSIFYELSNKGKQTVYDWDKQQQNNVLRQSLEVENLKLQNDSIKHKNSIREKQTEIDSLTIENLKLQNKQLKRYVLYSIIGFIFGLIVTEFQNILTYLKLIMQE